MFIDTSVFVAVLAGEDDAPGFIAAIDRARDRCTSPLVVLEATMVLATRLNKQPSDAQAAINMLIARTNISVVPITAETATSAVLAFERHGKGRGHSGQLNLTDCMAYAVAKSRNIPLLHKGNDFAYTDLA